MKTLEFSIHDESFCERNCHCDLNVKMASGLKRPRSSNFSWEEVLEMLLEEDEDHLGMSSDEESEIDRELGYQSRLLR